MSINQIFFCLLLARIELDKQEYFQFQEYMSTSRESDRSTSVVSDDVFDAAVPLGPACRPHS